MRLHQEIDRIFVGVRQVESAVESIRAARIRAGSTSASCRASSGAFIRRVIDGLPAQPSRGLHLGACPQLASSSRRPADQSPARRSADQVAPRQSVCRYRVADGVSAGLRHAGLLIGWRARRSSSRATSTANRSLPLRTTATLASRSRPCSTAHKVKANVVLDATVAPTVCEFVASGLGVSLIHPLFVDGLGGPRERCRRFEPALPFDFLDVPGPQQPQRQAWPNAFAERDARRRKPPMSREMARIGAVGPGITL